MTVIKVKNSSVAGKAPGASDLEVAELAINLADQKLYSKDASDAIFEIGKGVESGDTASRPTTPDAGDLYYDTSLNALLYWDGAKWEQITAEEIDGDGYVEKSPTGDATQNISGKLTVASTEDADPDATVVTKDYLGDYVSKNLWIDGGMAVSTFGSAPAALTGGNASGV